MARPLTTASPTGRLSPGDAWRYALLLTAAAAASRLPQLTSPNLLLDGDECLVGLMARHLLQRGAFPVFLSGQHYGLATIEAAAGALGAAAFGGGAAPLKIAMLAIWTTGVLFTFFALARLTRPSRAFWIAIALVLNPAWAVSSMKAWGGYVTAFAASAALVWLLLGDRPRESWIRWVLAGLLTALVGLAQPLWLPGLAPVAGALLVARRRIGWGLLYVGAAAAGFAAVHLAAADALEVWHPPPLGNPDPWHSLPQVAAQVFTSLRGSYYLWWPIAGPGPATSIVASVWCALLAGVVIVQLLRLVRRQYAPVTHVVFAGVVATIGAEWLLLQARDARYLLPLSGLLVPLIGLEAAALVDRGVLGRRVATAAAACVLVAGAISLYEFRQFNFLWRNPPTRQSEAARMDALIGYLTSHGATRTFAMNGLLAYQVAFYSNEHVLSRWFGEIDRLPAMVGSVDRALARGDAVAVIGYANTSGAPGCDQVPVCTGGIEQKVPNPEAIAVFDDKYFAFVGANRDLLRDLGFRIGG